MSAIRASFEQKKRLVAPIPQVVFSTKPPQEIVAALHFVLAKCLRNSVKVYPITSCAQRVVPPASRIKRVRPAGDTRVSTLPTFFQGSDIQCEDPDEYLAIVECKRLQSIGYGKFIKRGKAFLRTDKNASQRDRKNYNPRGRRGQSLKIDEAPPQLHAHGIMTRFVDGDRGAIVAVKGWRQGIHWRSEIRLRDAARKKANARGASA